MGAPTPRQACALPHKLNRPLLSLSLSPNTLPQPQLKAAQPRARLTTHTTCRADRRMPFSRNPQAPSWLPDPRHLSLWARQAAIVLGKEQAQLHRRSCSAAPSRLFLVLVNVRSSVSRLWRMRERWPQGMLLFASKMLRVVWPLDRPGCLSMLRCFASNPPGLRAKKPKSSLDCLDTLSSTASAS